MASQSPRPQLSPTTRLARIIGSGVLVILAAVYWYIDTPLRRTPASPDTHKTTVRRHPSLRYERQLTMQSSARQELPMVNKSIHTLRNIKHPTPAQLKQLASLRERQYLLRRLEDYELRLSLHQADSNVNIAALEQEIQHISHQLRHHTAHD